MSSQPQSPPLIGFPQGDLDAKMRQSRIHDTPSSITSSAQYSQSRHMVLGQEIESRLKIYLDTKFWIMLRDVDSCGGNDPSTTELLRLLQELVQSGREICPLADCAFMELLKQQQPEKRSATAALMDSLSQGVSLRFHEDRIRAEILHFILRRVEDTPPLSQLVWTRVGHLLGGFVPQIPGLEQHQYEGIAKGIDDLTWSLSLTDMVANRPIDVPESSEFYGRLAAKLNTGKFNHAAEATGFDTVLAAELQGVVDGYREIIDGALPYIHATRAGGTDSSDAEKRNSGQKLARLIVAAMSRNRELPDLPYFRICASAHAVIRLNKDRKFQPNDWLDILHATAALPYCDIFGTERSLATLLTQRPLQFDALYRTQIVRSPAELIRAIQTTLRSSEGLRGSIL